LGAGEKWWGPAMLHNRNFKEPHSTGPGRKSWAYKAIVGGRLYCTDSWVDLLAEVGRTMLFDGKLIHTIGCGCPGCLAFGVLAIRLHKAGPPVVVRAVFEDWDKPRLLDELAAVGK
jgi:hypothetical protein